MATIRVHHLLDDDPDHWPDSAAELAGETLLIIPEHAGPATPQRAAYAPGCWMKVETIDE